MAYQNKIFTNRSIPSGKSSRDRWNREYMISPGVAESLNTYRTHGIFPTNNDVGVIEWDPVSGETLPTQVGAPGVHSLFNKYGAVLTGAYDGYKGFDLKAGASADEQRAEMTDLVTGQSGSTEFRVSNNVPLMDSPKVRQQLKENAACSVKDLVNASKMGIFGRCVYSYSDFMYCKYLGRVPNNYLITLRRFPIPVTDAMLPVGVSRRSPQAETNSAKGAVPVGTMVTWLGVSDNNMEDILKYSYEMPFQEKEAGWQQVQNEGGGPNGQPTLLNGIAGIMNKASRQAWADGYKIPAIDSMMEKFGLKSGQGVYTKRDDHWDGSKVYGPIDRIKKNYRRSDSGIDWKWSFTLNFEYELRSYNGINPKQAMLDLLANILAVTYTNGEFWKGGYYGFEYGSTSAYQNMSIFKKTPGSYTGFMNTLTNTLSQGAKTAKDTLTQKAAEAKGLLVTNDDGSIDYVASAKALGNELMQFLNKVGGFDMIYSGLLNQLGRPERYAYPSLLSESPVGLWHVTIGNPRRPIIVAGNMIIKNVTVTHSGPLGLDDFPENLKVSVELDRGKPRDTYGIEALYMKGNDRIFHSMSKEVLDMYTSAAAYKGGSGTSTKTINISEMTSQTRDTALDTGVVDAATSDLLCEAFGDPDLEAIIMSSAEMAEGYFNAQDYVEDTSSSNGTSFSSRARETGNV